MVSRLLKKILKSFVTLYQWTISPLLGSCCRFAPSCSHYAKEALEKHSLFKALWLILKRLVKCGPWHPGGHDPVP